MSSGSPSKYRATLFSLASVRTFRFAMSWFALRMLWTMSGLSNARLVAVPPADDTAKALSQDNSSEAFFIVFVVAAVPGVGAAAFDYAKPANVTRSSACFLIFFPRETSLAQVKIRCTILASVS